MQKYINLLKSYLFFYILIILFSCSRNNLDVDVSDIKVSIKINRLDKDLFALPLDSIDAGIINIENKYGAFFDAYNHRIIRIGGTNNRMYSLLLKQFITDVITQEVKRDCDKYFNDLSFLEEQFNDAFKHLRYYFPNKKIPDIYTYISGFNQSIVTDENFIGIGLDKYLGKDYRFYTNLGLPNYKKRNMHKDKIISDAIYAYAKMEYEFNEAECSLLSKMLYEGKLLYFVDAMLPQMHDTLKMGYTMQQLEWCKKHEKKMWQYLIEKKLLFNTDLLLIKKFTDDGPFTHPFSNKSSPRAGCWIGWQIIKSFVEHNPTISLEQLMNNTNYTLIMNQSKYNPR